MCLSPDYVDSLIMFLLRTPFQTIHPIVLQISLLRNLSLQESSCQCCRWWINISEQDSYYWDDYNFALLCMTKTQISIQLRFCGKLPMVQTVRNLPVIQETWVQSLGWEDLLEKEMATHSSILAWRIPWIEETGGLQLMFQSVRHNWVTNTFTFFFLSSV